MHAWNRITPMVGGAIISASEAVGTKPRRHRLVSLVNMTYKFVRMNVNDNAIVLSQRGYGEIILLILGLCAQVAALRVHHGHIR